MNDIKRKGKTGQKERKSLSLFVGREYIFFIFADQQTRANTRGWTTYRKRFDFMCRVAISGYSLLKYV